MNCLLTSNNRRNQSPCSSELIINEALHQNRLCVCAAQQPLYMFQRAMSNAAHRTDRTQKALQQKRRPAVASMHLAVGVIHPAVATTHPAVAITHLAVATMQLAMATMHLAVGAMRLAAATMPLAIKWQQAHPATGLSCLPAMMQP